jgi:hypothetical protein
MHDPHAFNFVIVETAVEEALAARPDSSAQDATEPGPLQQVDIIRSSTIIKVSSVE